MEKAAPFHPHLSRLRIQHAALEEQIETIRAEPFYDQLAVQRLKRLKLQIREQIDKIKNSLLPDISA